MLILSGWAASLNIALRTTRSTKKTARRIPARRNDQQISQDYFSFA
jgi:hypothetical protein